MAQDAKGAFYRRWKPGSDAPDQSPFHSGLLSAAGSDPQLAEFAFEALPTACLIKNDRLEYCRINANFCAILGARPQDLIGRTASAIFSDDVARQFEAREQRVLDTGQSISFEERVRHADGDTIDLLTRINRIVIAGGSRFICITVTDVTELKAAIREREAQTELLRESASAMAQGLLVFGAEEIEFVSEKTPDLLGMPSSVLAVGRDWRTLHRTGTGSAAEEMSRDTHKLLKSVQSSLEKRRAEKLEHATSAGKTVLVDHAPRKNGGAIVTITDVTESARIARELAGSKRKAETADRAKTEFLANMSHEIRTPMNGVMGMAELLARTELDDKQQMFTNVIVKSGAALLTIINDILDFSKIDAGQLTLDPKPFCIGEAIEDVAALMLSGAAEKDLELIVRIDPDLPTMLVGDAGRLRQVVTNLIGNAVKFTDRGHVYVNVNGSIVGVGDNRRSRLKISVEDTGIGIPPEKCRRVFDKFSQIDASSTRKHEGTGLGLAIASSLVRLMGGRIEVKSKVGVGSTFWFEIELPVSGEQMRHAPVPLDVTGARILVVDDNAVNRAILTEQMAAWRFDSAAAVSGDEALKVLSSAAAQNITVDCVVLDYHMPGMNGAELVKTMRRDRRFCGIPVIMLTSVDQMEGGRTFSSLGIEAHLTKPARASMLLETIIAVLTQRGDGQAAPPDPDSNAADGDDEAVRTVPRKAAPDKGMDVTSESRGRIDVLVCEDNDVNQIVFTQILKETDLSFHIASNGREGLSCYKRMQPSIVMMDVSMPVMNGYQATRAIRAIEAQTGAHTPIIGVTAHAIKSDMENCLAAGMDDYVSKPVSPEKLMAKINQWMDRDEGVPERDVSA